METLDKIHSGLVKACGFVEDLVDFLSSSMNIDKYREVLDKVTAKKQKTSTDVLDNYIFTFDQIETAEKLINSLSTMVLDPEQHSSTFRAEVSTQIAKASAKFSAFKRDIQEMETEMLVGIVDKVVEDIFKAEDRLAAIDKLRAKYHKSNCLIKIYASVMQRCVDNLDRQLAYKLLDYIAEDKDLVLMEALDDTKAIKTTNPPASRFGLVPATKSMELSELIPIVFKGEKVTSADDSIKKLADKLTNGIILFTSITYTPVEYNIRPLIIRDEAKEFLQPKEYGITKKVVTRFNTITTAKPTNKWDFSLDIYNEKAEKFYILETLDGKTYRAMLPWLMHNSTYTVAKFRVKNLLEHTNGPVRSDGYQKLAVDAAVKNMFLGKALSLDDFDSKLSDVESGGIQDKIFNSIIKVAEKLVSKEFKSKITSSTQINELLHHPAINQEFARAVTAQLKSDPAKLDGGKFPTSELASSFIVSLQTASRRFAREVHNGYSRNPLKPEDFADARVVFGKIESVIRNAVELVVKLDDNLFTSSYYKYLILNYAG